tara:strand:- start:581 stop:733 length:153 start_codon:yes stop_codon:yes gene_type:complete
MAILTEKVSFGEDSLATAAAITTALTKLKGKKILHAVIVKRREIEITVED